MKPTSARPSSQPTGLKLLKEAICSRDTQDGLGLIFVLLFLFLVVPFLLCRYTVTHDDYLPDRETPIQAQPASVGPARHLTSIGVAR